MLPQTDNIEEKENDKGKDRIASYASEPVAKEEKMNLLTLFMWVIGFFPLVFVAFKVIRGEWAINLLGTIL